MEDKEDMEYQKKNQVEDDQEDGTDEDGCDHEQVVEETDTDSESEYVSDSDAPESPKIGDGEDFNAPVGGENTIQFSLDQSKSPRTPRGRKPCNSNSGRVNRKVSQAKPENGFYGANHLSSGQSGKRTGSSKKNRATF